MGRGDQSRRRAPSGRATVGTGNHCRGPAGTGRGENAEIDRILGSAAAQRRRQDSQTADSRSFLGAFGEKDMTVTPTLLDKAKLWPKGRQFEDFEIGQVFEH